MSITKVGFLLSHMGNTELSNAFVKNANDFLNTHQHVDIIGFVGNQVKPVFHPTFATMNTNEAFDYDGAVVAFGLGLANQLRHFPGPRKKYNYMWELDWVGYGFEELLRVFNDPNMPVVARSESDKNLIERCWNCKVKAVIPDCNVEAFVEMIKKDEK